MKGMGVLSVRKKVEVLDGCACCWILVVAEGSGYKDTKEEWWRRGGGSEGKERKSEG